MCRSRMTELWLPEKLPACTSSEASADIFRSHMRACSTKGRRAVRAAALKTEQHAEELMLVQWQQHALPRLYTCRKPSKQPSHSCPSMQLTCQCITR